MHFDVVNHSPGSARHSIGLENASDLTTESDEVIDSRRFDGNIRAFGDEEPVPPPRNISDKFDAILSDGIRQGAAPGAVKSTP
jgi:hypothetical protein